MPDLRRDAPGRPPGVGRADEVAIPRHQTLKVLGQDGGVAGAGMEQPFANNPSYTGHVNWDPHPRSATLADLSVTDCAVHEESKRGNSDFRRLHYASAAVVRGLSSFQCPSETTSTVPSTTLMAVWSSMA